MATTIGWLVLLLGCEGTIDLVGADAGGDAPPDVRIDAGTPAPGVDAGAIDLLDAGAPAVDAGAPAGLRWKATLFTGDDSIVAFDNAREALAELVRGEGVDPVDIAQLSREASEQTGGIGDTSVDAIEQAMVDLGVGEGEGCFVHMTSHGNRQGFYIRGRDYLSPTRLDAILDRACGARPTVVLISACYSGVFVDPLSAPNRVVLTAAREDRTSFGCSAEATYTYWDGCLIEHWGDARTWGELYGQVTKCIEEKEARGFTPSLPQMFLGAEVMELPIFDR